MAKKVFVPVSKLMLEAGNVIQITREEITSGNFKRDNIIDDLFPEGVTAYTHITRYVPELTAAIDEFKQWLHDTHANWYCNAEAIQAKITGLTISHKLRNAYPLPLHRSFIFYLVLMADINFLPEYPYHKVITECRKDFFDVPVASLKRMVSRQFPQYPFWLLISKVKDWLKANPQPEEWGDKCGWRIEFWQFWTELMKEHKLPEYLEF